MTEQLYNSSSMGSSAKTQQDLSTSQGNLGSVSSASTQNASAGMPSGQPVTQELKSKRVQLLRMLAIKTGALLDWNLLQFEKE
jgi:hypothetical protein